MTKKPDIDDLMLIMDSVDEVRHSATSPDALMTDEGLEETRKTLIDIYTSQGIPVTDELIDKGIAAFREDRFKFKPLKPGKTRFLALMYVRRKLLAFCTAGTVAACVVGGIAHHQLVTVPQMDRLAALELTYTEKLPRQLDLAVKSAEADIALSPADLRETARADVDKLKHTAVDAMENREGERAVSAIAGIKRVASDLRAATIAKENRLRKEAEFAQALAHANSVISVLAKHGPDIKDLETPKAIQAQIAKISAAKESGNLEDLTRATSEAKEFNRYLSAPLTFEIVQERGVKSGVLRTNPAYPDANIYYLVVDALDPSGSRFPIQVTDVETGSKTNKSRFAIRVSPEKFAAVKDDKKSDGMIDDRFMGEKPANTINITWATETPGTMITKW